MAFLNDFKGSKRTFGKVIRRRKKSLKSRQPKSRDYCMLDFFGFETTFSAVPAQFSEVFVIFRRTNFWPTGNRIENGFLCIMTKLTLSKKWGVKAFFVKPPLIHQLKTKFFPNEVLDWKNKRTLATKECNSLQNLLRNRNCYNFQLRGSKGSKGYFSKIENKY